jgi:hypothetical protein
MIGTKRSEWRILTLEGEFELAMQPIDEETHWRITSDRTASSGQTPRHNTDLAENTVI